MEGDRPLVVVAAALAASLFLFSWAALHYGPYKGRRIVDTPIYQSYGDAMANGSVPYRDFRPEYPPGAMPVFVIPSLIQPEPGEAGYERAFGWLMAVCGAAAIALTVVSLLALEAGPLRLTATLAFAALWPLALGPVTLTRFDLWPAALTAGALAAFLAGRDRLGSGVLAAAVAAKLFPVVLAPLAAVWIWRRRGRRIALVCGGIFGAVLVAAFIPFAILGPGGLGSSLGRQLSRPLQIESLGAAILVALHQLAGLDVSVISSHGSQNIAGTLADAVGAASTAVELVVLLAAWIVFARGPADRERLVRFAALALVAFVALGKVLSPQFVIWLVPVVPLVAGRRGVAAAGMLAAVLLLTQSWFPRHYWDYATGLDETMTWRVLTRDLLLVALLVLLSRSEPGPARTRAPVRRERTRPALPRS